MNVRYLWFAALLWPILGNCQEKKDLNLNEIYGRYAFYQEGITASKSLPNGKEYTEIDFTNGEEQIATYKYKDGLKSGVLLTNDSLLDSNGKRLIFSDYSISSDSHYILLTTGEVKIYRHSRAADYYLYNTETHALDPLTDFSKGKQRLAAFSPDGKKVAFVRNNNLFYLNIASKREYTITTDGKHDSIINGATDWVYEEEFGLTKGFQWSPNSDKIAYCRFDESRVKQYTLTYFNALYPEEYTYKYPKAGTQNSTVNILVYDLSAQESRDCDLGTITDQYIPRFMWTASDNELCVLRMNRLQNRLDFLNFDTSVKTNILASTLMYRETAADYLEIESDPIFLPDNKDFIWQSEKSGYSHLWLVNMDTKKSCDLVSGKWDVNELYGYDARKNEVYFSAAKENPTVMAVYKTSTKGPLRFLNHLDAGDSMNVFDNSKSLKCLTINGGYNSASFSADYKYFINTYNDTETPDIITLRDNDGKVIRVLEDNAKLRKKLADYRLSPYEFGELKTDSGVTLNYYMIKPPDFDPNKKYPVLFHIYGGPHYNEVTRTWKGQSGLWNEMMAEKGYIIFAVDPRGTFFRGNAFKQSIYLNMGKDEAEDMAASARWLSQQPYVDSARIGIQGWSFGGYLSALCLTKESEYFKLGVAIAPVTNWRFYDTIYTERYLRKPQDNPTGYDDNSPLNYADQLKGKLFIAAGLVDDNVHYQNTAEFIMALVGANKQFEQLTYPNEDHGLGDGNSRRYLFEKITRFISQNL